MYNIENKIIIFARIKNQANLTFAGYLMNAATIAAHIAKYV